MPSCVPLDLNQGFARGQSLTFYFMITDHLIAIYDRPVPRYTSYPTAPHFHAGIDSATSLTVEPRETASSPMACVTSSRRAFRS